MSNLSDLDTMILRDTSNPPLTNKGSELTYGEFDGNFIEIYNAIQDIVNGANVPAYDAAATYDQYSTDPKERFVSYDSRIWSATYNGSPSTFTGQTPAEGSYWTQISLAQMLGNPVSLTKIAEAFDDTREAAGIYIAELEIATADVLTLNGTPLEIVAAPGAGKVIEVISASRKLTFNSIVYATNTRLALIHDTATDVLVEWGNAGLNASVTNILQGAINLATAATDTQLIENKAVMVTVEIGEATAGNSDIKVYVVYRIITL